MSKQTAIQQLEAVGGRIDTSGWAFPDEWVAVHATDDVAEARKLVRYLSGTMNIVARLTEVDGSHVICIRKVIVGKEGRY